MNDYWTRFGHTHHIDLQAIKSLCFQLICMFQASRTLADRCALIELETIEQGETHDPGADQLLRLHDEFINAQASQVLLSLAMVVRVYDDHLKNSPRAAAYEGHHAAKNGDNNIGHTSDQDRFNYRDACNKIIHALRMRFLEEDIEYQNSKRPVPYFTGDVELTGRRGNTEWNAQFDIESFVETILDIVDFGYDEPTGTE